jgi:hypothetical protein
MRREGLGAEDVCAATLLFAFGAPAWWGWVMLSFLTLALYKG